MPHRHPRHAHAALMPLVPIDTRRREHQPRHPSTRSSPPAQSTHHMDRIQPPRSCESLHTRTNAASNGHHPGPWLTIAQRRKVTLLPRHAHLDANERRPDGSPRHAHACCTAHCHDKMSAAHAHLRRAHRDALPIAPASLSRSARGGAPRGCTTRRRMSVQTDHHIPHLRAMRSSADRDHSYGE